MKGYYRAGGVDGGTHHSPPPPPPPAPPTHLYHNHHNHHHPHWLALTWQLSPNHYLPPLALSSASVSFLSIFIDSHTYFGISTSCPSFVSLPSVHALCFLQFICTSVMFSSASRVVDRSPPLVFWTAFSLSSLIFSQLHSRLSKRHSFQRLVFDWRSILLFA